MNATEKREARPRYQRQARHAGNGKDSVADGWERGTFWGGIIFAASFGLMFLYAGVTF